MAPDTVRYVIFDDKTYTLESFSTYFDRCGHKKVAEAQSVPAALGVINALVENGEIIDVAFVDGNFTRGQLDGSEGKQIADTIRELLPGVTIIGLSGNPTLWSDHPEISKRSSIADIEKLARSLPARKSE